MIRPKTLKVCRNLGQVFTQVEDGMIDEEGELDEQYTTIEIDYKTEVIEE